MALAIAAGQVGCATLVIVLAAVFLGLWLDSRMGTKPTLTIIFIVGSIPVSLLVMLFLARAAVSRIRAQNPAPPGRPQKIDQEDSDFGKHE